MRRTIAAGVLAVANGVAVAGPRVAIVAAATNTANEQTADRFTDPRDKLMSTGLFDEVAIISTTPYGGGHTPTLAELLQYDAVLTWTNDSHDDSVGVGNVLADYVDAGGGVVVSVFTNTSLNPDRQLLGRWADEGYGLIPTASNYANASAPLAMGDVLIEGHPILTGVESFRSFAAIVPSFGPWGAFRPNTTLVNPGAHKLALWEDGKTLIVVGDTTTPGGHKVVELGMHPVSSAVNSTGYWDESTDGARMMANALLWAAFGPADWTMDGAVNFDDVIGFLGAFGAGVEAADLDFSGGPDFTDVVLFLQAFGEATGP
ncbi:MAG: hypothetical protein R3B57_01525 [Phycisphaerales bacterium]